MKCHLLCGCCVLGLVAMIAGCPPPTPPEPEDVEPDIYTGPVETIGELDGALADDAGIAFSFTPFDGAGAPVPIFLAGGTVHTIDATHTAALRDAFLAFHPVVLIDATQADIAALNALLETGLAFSMAEGFDRVEIYALDYEDGGHLFQWSQYPPVLAGDETDDTDYQTRRMNSFVAWLASNGTRMDEHETPDAVKGEDLLALANAFNDKTNFWQDGVSYQIIHYVYSCHSVGTSRDWFYIEQRGIITAKDAYKGRYGYSTNYGTSSYHWYDPMVGDMAEYYLGTVEFDSSMNGALNDTNQVFLDRDSPTTDNTSETITSGFTWNLGGTVTFNANGQGIGGAAAVNSGITIQHLDAVSIKDCTVLNTCNDQGNNAHWKYEFKKCAASSNAFCYVFLSDPPNLAITSFQPINQWVWGMNQSPRERAASMHVKFKANLVSSKGVVDFMWWCHADHDTSKGFAKEYDVSIPYPPTSADKN